MKEKLFNDNSNINPYNFLTNKSAFNKLKRELFGENKGKQLWICKSDFIFIENQIDTRAIEISSKTPTSRVTSAHPKLPRKNSVLLDKETKVLGAQKETPMIIQSMKLDGSQATKYYSGHAGPNKLISKLKKRSQKLLRGNKSEFFNMQKKQVEKLSKPKIRVSINHKNGSLESNENFTDEEDIFQQKELHHEGSEQILNRY